GLDAATTATAVSLAASQAGGLRAQFGTSAKPLQAGLAAQSAVQAVQLALAGAEANPDFLDSRAGFLAAHGAAGDLDELHAGWGRSWRILEPGLWFKQHPFCSAAMSASDAAASLAGGALAEVVRTGRVDEIRDVVVTVPRGGDTALRHTRPRTGEEGRFSVEYVVALQLTGRRPDLEHLGTAPVEPEVDALVSRTAREHVDRGPAADGGRSFWSRVSVTRADGRTLAAEVENPRGSPRNPLGPDDHRAKLVAATGSASAAAAVHEAVVRVIDGDVGSLVEALHAAVPTVPSTDRQQTAPPRQGSTA
ncbi:MmgE/PrpD family protein, partial [Georgenia subflava]